MKRKWWLLFLIFALILLSCRFTGEPGPPRNALVIQVAATPTLEDWLTGVVADFNQEKIKVESGRSVYIQVTYIEAGAFAADLMNMAVFDLWIPDQSVWVDVVKEGGYPDFVGDCVSVATSPLVIAMWQPLAEALGWPGKDLGWLDLGSLAADPSAWAYYSGGQFGQNFRMGHAHPGLSASGTATLLAVVQAAQSKVTAVSSEEIAEPIVQASVSAFEGSVATFTQNSRELIALMVERGPQFLNAVVAYESQILGVDPDAASIIPIYPFEGTYMAEFPACINQGMTPETQTGSDIFRAALLMEEAQKMAWESGLRPVGQPQLMNPDDHPLIDSDKPAVVFDPPTPDAVLAIQDLWQSARKPLNLVMVIDTSGSMNGSKLENVKSAAADLISVMGEDDRVSLIIYNQSSEPEVVVYDAEVGGSRQEIIDLIRGLKAWNGTPLYDSIGLAAQTIAETQSGASANAMIVLTDGLDTESIYHRFNQSLVDMARANDTAVYTVAYGQDADEEMLADLALQAYGQFYAADEANIAEIYGDMSVKFGGSLGIGR
jgi:Ca-activated chloride channel family protein